MLLDKDKIKNSLTKQEIIKILIDLGSGEPKFSKDENMIFTTVCHNRCNGSHKLYYYKDSKTFHCYTDCSDTFDIYELVIRTKKQQGYDISLPKAIQYVATLTGKEYGIPAIINNSNEIIDDFIWINRHKKKEKINIELPSYDEKVLDVFLKLPHECWINESISIQTMKDFEIGYYIREEKISIVHRDINSRFIGLRGRSMRQEDIENGKKYMPLTIENTLYNHSTMMNLYGLDKTKYAVQKIKKIMFFEGEKSVLKCQDYYGDLNFTCAVCSSNISNFHRDIALSLGVQEVFIAFDKYRAKKEKESDEVYKNKIIEYQERLIKYARKFTSYCTVYILWDDNNLLDYKDSPVDKGKEILEMLMKNKIEIKTVNEVE